MKKLVFALLYRVGLIRLAAWSCRRRTVIICYHSVTERPRPIHDEEKLHLPVELFAAHLGHLRRHYEVISLREYLGARREGRTLPDYTAVLTFDDGLRNLLTVIAPRLVALSLPATAFVITGLTTESAAGAAGQGDGPLSDDTQSDDQVYLSWPELAELARLPGIEIGSHSHSHPDLTAIPPEQARRELRESYAAVVGHLGGGPPALAYPHGRANPEVSEIAASLGYACGLTGELGDNGDDCGLYELRRVVIAGDDDLPTFAARVSGLTGWYGRLRTAFGRGAEGARPRAEARGPSLEQSAFKRDAA